VYGIVNQLGGVLRIRSAPNRGAAVTIHLPTADEAAGQAADQPGGTPQSTRTPTGGSETILVAEDEDGIHDTLTRTLTRAGYTVLAAANGADALKLAEQHTQAIHLLLSDVVMPGMLGDELAAHLLERRPDTKILFMSGYAGDLMNRYGVLEPGVTALPKPFTAVRTMIDVQATR
jgi:two-component system cell cycle sensor histidine kinase/response regulator CckA